MPITREILEGTQVQGIDESRSWVMLTSDIDVAGDYLTPSSVTSVKAYSFNKHKNLYTDVTVTVMPAGAATISGRYITLPPLTALTEGVFYRIECKYVTGGNTLEKYMWIQAER